VLSCALLIILLIAWPMYESTAWFRVQHCLKPEADTKKKRN